MSARLSVGAPTRGSSISRSTQRRKVVVNVDLNVPATENHDEGTSNFLSTSNAVPNTQGAPPQPVPFDVDLINDDDVLISSPRAFAEAKNKARRNRRQGIVDVDAEASSSNNPSKRHRGQGNHQVINCEFYVNLECEAYNSRAIGVRHKQQMPPLPPPPPPPKEPAISCPICMGPLVEEMSTKCGHIFCKGCIKAALALKNKCPTCRRKIAMKDTIRIYLPTRTYSEPLRGKPSAEEDSCEGAHTRPHSEC